MGSNLCVERVGNELGIIARRGYIHHVGLAIEHSLVEQASVVNSHFIATPSPRQKVRSLRFLHAFVQFPRTTVTLVARTRRDSTRALLPHAKKHPYINSADAFRPVLCPYAAEAFRGKGHSIWGGGVCHGSTKRIQYHKIEPAVPRKELLPVATQQTRCCACPDRPSAAHHINHPCESACRIYGDAFVRSRYHLNQSN